MIILTPAKRNTPDKIGQSARRFGEMRLKYLLTLGKDIFKIYEDNIYLIMVCTFL